MKSNYYMKEFNRIYTRFCFNLGLFGSYHSLRGACYREAMTAVETLKQRATVNHEVDESFLKMCLNTICNINKLYKKVSL